MPKPSLAIETQEQLNALLDRHPHLRDRPNFLEEYRRARWYVILKSLQRRGDIPDVSNAELAHHTKISRTTLSDWFNDYTTPLLVRRLAVSESALKEYEAQLTPEIRKHLIHPSALFQILQPFRNSPSLGHPETLTTIMDEIYKTKNNLSKIIFAEFHHYQNYGPRWVQRIPKSIEKHQEKVEELNKRISRADHSHTKLCIGVVNYTVYLWHRDMNPDNWFNLYSRELFHFNTLAVKQQLMDKVRKHLNLDSDSKLGHLIKQITEHPTETTLTKISDLYRNNTRLFGESLHFFLNTIDANLTDFQSFLTKIGRNIDKQGMGGIMNPRFPTGEFLDEFRTRVFAIIACDGNVSNPKRARSYYDNDPYRVQYVKALFSKALGDVHCKETTKGKLTRLVMSVVVGRILEKWGIPIGDKILQQFRLPSSILKAPPRLKKCYLEELIPEDGSFNTTGPSGIFEWRRATLLDAGAKAERYCFVSKISPELKVFIRQYGKGQVTVILGEAPRNEIYMRWTRLQRLAKKAKDTLIGKVANQLAQVILENPCELLESEIELCASLGIGITRVPMKVLLYETGRVSVVWRAKTKGQKYALRWAILAPPSSGYKRRAVEKWLLIRSDVQEVKARLQHEGMVPA